MLGFVVVPVALAMVFFDELDRTILITVFFGAVLAGSAAADFRAAVTLGFFFGGSAAEAVVCPLGVLGFLGRSCRLFKSTGVLIITTSSSFFACVSSGDSLST